MMKNPGRQKRDPPVVRRRIKALLKIQLEAFALRADMTKAILEFEAQFSEKMKPLEEKRQAIVAGLYEPTDEDCDLRDKMPRDQKLNYDLEDIDLDKTLANMALDSDDEEVSNAKIPHVEFTICGVPSFWGEVLQGCSLLATRIDDEDVPILKCLTDVTLQMFSNAEQQGYKIFFQFGPNPYFKNTVLTKTFFTSCGVKYDNPFSVVHEAWPLHCEGCEIEWLSDSSNLTFNFIKTKKTDSKGRVRDLVRKIEKPSFFHFFKTISLKTQNQSRYDLEEKKEELEEDFKCGEIIRTKVIPGAAWYYVNPDDTENASDDENVSQELLVFGKRDRDGRFKISVTDVECSPSSTGEGMIAETSHN
ncbi:nucleosome assembly protein 1-like 1 isoform X2 [Folsomia candida]|uniref:nucleosome assembly protein 1-like 1 isoform X2 n=1 Tax=Folsomia candida TaxID=158441 RepID=UPI000B8F3AE0|nr:nucleosome assembly protein 1-like 1 isoform X2 [Folsomia candida]